MRHIRQLFQRLFPPVIPLDDAVAIDAAPERVWEALSDSQERRRWDWGFAPRGGQEGEFRRLLPTGCRLRFRFEGGRGEGETAFVWTETLQRRRRWLKSFVLEGRIIPAGRACRVEIEAKGAFRPFFVRRYLTGIAASIIGRRLVLLKNHCENPEQLSGLAQRGIHLH